MPAKSGRALKSVLHGTDGRFPAGSSAKPANVALKTEVRAALSRIPSNSRCGHHTPDPNSLNTLFIVQLSSNFTLQTLNWLCSRPPASKPLQSRLRAPASRPPVPTKASSSPPARLPGKATVTDARTPPPALVRVLQKPLDALTASSVQSANTLELFCRTGALQSMSGCSMLPLPTRPRHSKV